MTGGVGVVEGFFLIKRGFLSEEKGVAVFLVQKRHLSL